MTVELFDIYCKIFSFFDLVPLCDIISLKDLKIALLLKKDRD